MDRMICLAVNPSLVAQVRSDDSAVCMLRMDLGERGPRGDPIWVGNILLVEPSKEGDQLLAAEGRKREIVFEETPELLQCHLVVQDRVGAPSCGPLVVDEAFASLGKGKLANHKVSSLAGDSDNHRL